MHHLTRHQGKLEILQRMKNTPNGNPRWRCRIAGHTCVTKSDASYAYELTNHMGTDVIATIGIHYGVETLASVRAVEREPLPVRWLDIGGAA